MKRHIATIVAAAAVLSWSASEAATTKESQAVRTMIEKVNNHWQANNPAETWSFWDNAAYHTGNMEAYFLSLIHI